MYKRQARDGFDRAIERERAAQAGEGTNDESAKPAVPAEGAARDPSMTLIPIIELCRVCPGMVTAMGVSMGLTASAIMSKGTCLLYTSPSPRDRTRSRMPSSA